MKLLTCLCASLVAYASAVQAQEWDISAMHGPSEMVRFTVSEGIWMNLDVSPDGESIVFDLLGDLYLLPIKGGEARALTQGPAFDVQPRFSPDGQSIVCTAWSDEVLGRIYGVSLNGRTSVALTELPRVYHSPRYSPDESNIVYCRGKGNSLLGYLNSTDPGLYWTPAEGRRSQLVRSGGRDPRFDRTGERVLFLSGYGLSKSYEDTDLTGVEEQTHYTPKNVTDVLPSPDENWITNYIWGITDDLLRDVYLRGKYHDVVLPMTLLRQEAGQVVLQHFEVHAPGPAGAAKVAPTSGRLRGQSERLLTHRVGHRRQLRVPPLDPEAIQVRNLGNADRQIQFGRDRSQSRGLASHAMGTVFRELVRHFNGSEKAGEHFTPRDTLTVLITLAFQSIARPEAVDPEACRAQADPDYAREHVWISYTYP